MKIGFIGAGNMARALARGWGDPVLCSDTGSGRGQALVDELGGSVASNADVARGADLVFLCHKPHQLAEVAGEIAGLPRAIASVLGGVTVEELRTAYPGVPVFRIEPNTPVEVRRGVMLYAAAPDVDADLERDVLTLHERLGWVARVPESAMGAASAMSGVGPAYLALVAEAQVDAGIRHGLRPALAARLATETMAGAAALLAAADGDTLAVRRAVTSPGGSTARGLAALEHGGVRPAFSDAMDAVDRMIALAAVTRGDVADYVSAVFFVYIVLIFVQLLATMLFSFGLRMPYARWTDAVLGFLRDVADPYLRLFRRFIPAFGGIDLSPVLAIFVLYVVRTIVVGVIRG